MSGLVERVKTGCSIEAMSPFGTASTISQTNKSFCGWRSGSRGERAFVISHTTGPSQVSSFHTPKCLWITFYQDSSFHTPRFVISHTTGPSQVSSFHTPKCLWITFYQDSSFHTP